MTVIDVTGAVINTTCIMRHDDAHVPFTELSVSDTEVLEYVHLRYRVIICLEVVGHKNLFARDPCLEGR